MLDYFKYSVIWSLTPNKNFLLENFDMHKVDVF